MFYEGQTDVHSMVLGGWVGSELLTVKKGREYASNAGGGEGADPVSVTM